MTFDDILAKTLRYEGVLSDHANDKGGLTKYGITIPAYSEFLGQPATKEQIRNLTKEIASNIYFELYWRRPGIDKIFNVSPLLACAVFDFAVNSGPNRAIRYLQRLIAVQEDGQIGAKTLIGLISTIAAVNEKNLYNLYVLSRGEFLMRLIERDRSQSVFAIGWFRRITSQLEF
jgi:lysozyme family protein